MVGVELRLRKRVMTKSIQITFQRSKLSLNAEPGTNLLELTDRGGPRIPSLCRGGSCGTCKVRVLAGKVEQGHTKALTQQEIKAGYILACSTFLTGPLTIDV